MLYNLTYMWNLKNKRKITKLTDTENTWVVTRGRGGGWEVGKME